MDGNCHVGDLWMLPPQKGSQIYLMVISQAGDRLQQTTSVGGQDDGKVKGGPRNVIRAPPRARFARTLGCICSAELEGKDPAMPSGVARDYGTPQDPIFRTFSWLRSR